MEANRKEKEKQDPPFTIYDPKTKFTYLRKEFLGRGGFARCWEFKNEGNGIVYAGKVVSKQSLQRSSQRSKMKQEILIHRDLRHAHIVQFQGSFEDSEFIYVILEMCNRRTLMELHKRRKTITEPEARYFSRQIATGVKYLHDNNIIHRDLKLANIFLDSELNVKIGDFGLATWVKNNEKKETLCGTPNYIAPEILNKVGHSFEVDAWSLGCILYTLLVGRPPFETKDLEKTYSLIKSNRYQIPSSLSLEVQDIIKLLLNSDPTKRPTMSAFMRHEFFYGFTPDSLPLSILTTEPRFDHIPARSNQVSSFRTPFNQQAANRIDDGTHVGSGGEFVNHHRSSTATFCENFSRLQKMLCSVLGKARVLKAEEEAVFEECEDPGSSPIYWISRWVDYSDKYGIGYELCDSSYGVLFNDLTRLLQTADDRNLQYIDKHSKEELFTIDSFPESLRKKVDLLTNFRQYMQENLCKAGEHVNRRECDAMARLPYLVMWLRNSYAIILYLSNGTLQMNFFQDHVKIIMCPLMNAVSIINQQQRFRTYSITSIEENGITKELYSRFDKALEMMGHLKKSGTILSSVGESPMAVDENRAGQSRR